MKTGIAKLKEEAAKIKKAKRKKKNKRGKKS
jgi:hypothetical protein